MAYIKRHISSTTIGSRGHQKLEKYMFSALYENSNTSPLLYICLYFKARNKTQGVNPQNSKKFA